MRAAAITLLGVACACGRKEPPSAASAGPSLSALLATVPAASSAPEEDGGACSATHPGGCTAAAKKLRATDPAKAAELFTIGCDGGSIRSCVDLGGILAEGEGVPKDSERARALFLRACAAENPWGCHNLGVVLRDHLHVDEGIALEALERACERLPASCHDAADSYAKGLGVPKDMTRAAAALRRACDHDVARSCVALGRYMKDGELPDPERAFGELFDKACDLNDGDGCAYAGIVHLATAADAIARFEKGCTLGSKAACSVLGDYLSDGAIVSKDPERAAQAYDRACALKDSASCAQSKQLRSASRAPTPGARAPAPSASP